MVRQTASFMYVFLPSFFMLGKAKCKYKNSQMIFILIYSGNSNSSFLLPSSFPFFLLCLPPPSPFPSLPFPSFPSSQHQDKQGLRTLVPLVPDLILVIPDTGFQDSAPWFLKHNRNCQISLGVFLWRMWSFEAYPPHPNYVLRKNLAFCNISIINSDTQIQRKGDGIIQCFFLIRMVLPALTLSWGRTLP